MMAAMNNRGAFVPAGPRATTVRLWHPAGRGESLRPDIVQNYPLFRKFPCRSLGSYCME
jgi:hypothetical protein